MTFAPIRSAAGIAVAAISLATIAPWLVSPALADANLPHDQIVGEETILYPVPDCPKCLVLSPGRRLDDRVFVGDCTCPD